MSIDEEGISIADTKESFRIAFLSDNSKLFKKLLARIISEKGSEYGFRILTEIYKEYTPIVRLRFQRILIDALEVTQLVGCNRRFVEFVEDIPETNSIESVCRYLNKDAEMVLSSQIDSDESTIFLDVDTIMTSSAARLVSKIVKSRKREAEEVVLFNYERLADLLPLWNTAYGFKLLSTLGVSRYVFPSGLELITDKWKELGFQLEVVEASDGNEHVHRPRPKEQPHLFLDMQPQSDSDSYEEYGFEYTPSTESKSILSSSKNKDSLFRISELVGILLHLKTVGIFTCFAGLRQAPRDLYSSIRGSPILHHDRGASYPSSIIGFPNLIGNNLPLYILQGNNFVTDFYFTPTPIVFWISYAWNHWLHIEERLLSTLKPKYPDWLICTLFDADSKFESPSPESLQTRFGMPVYTTIRQTALYVDSIERIIFSRIKSQLDDLMLGSRLSETWLSSTDDPSKYRRSYYEQ